MKLLPLLFIALLACSTQKKVKVQQNSYTSQVSKQALPKQNIAPSTCMIKIHIDELIQKENHFSIKASIKEVIEYGSGFTSTFYNDQKIIIQVPQILIKSLKENTTVKCQISSFEKMNQAVQFKLIKLN